MKSQLRLALLLSLLIGCARAPVNPTPANEDPVKPAPAIAIPAPTPNKSEDVPHKGIAKPRPNPEVVRNTERGIVRGVVLWEGAEPVSPTPRLRIDAATRGVAQTAVWLVSSRKQTTPPPREPVRLSVERGEYQPHVLLAQKGGILELGTVEDRADFQASGAATFSETLRRGDRRTFPLASSGLIEIRSQLQPKRAPAYVWALDGGSGVLTASDGTFRLPPVSAGEYELVLWHENWQTNALTPPTARLRLSLGDNDGAEVRWTLPLK